MFEQDFEALGFSLGPRVVKTRTTIAEIFDRFLARQNDLFQALNDLTTQYLEDIATTTSASDRSMYKNVLRSIDRFDGQFGEIEADFWTFLENDPVEMEYSDQFAREKGYDSFIEYLLAELEKCHAWIDEIMTEVSASGWEWDPEKNSLADHFWQLMDATEELFEASAKGLPRDELVELLAKIPSQRKAPIQLEVKGAHFTLKRSTRNLTRVGAKAMKSALGAIRAESSDALRELRATNADRRFLSAFERLHRSLEVDFNSVDPIEIGINLVIVENSASTIRDEIGGPLYGRLLGVIVSVRTFVFNYREWGDYCAASVDFASNEAVLSSALRIEVSLGHEAFDDAVREQSRFYAKNVEQLDSDAGKIVRSGFILGMQNVVSIAFREVLKFLRLCVNKTVENIGKTIGAVAAAWVMLNLEALKSFARSHSSFSWMIDVIEFIQKNMPH
jgi:hypothetical protein